MHREELRGTPPALLGVTHISVRGGGHAYAIRAVLMLWPGHDVARSAGSIGLCSARSHAPSFPQSLIKMSLHDSRAENPAWYGLGLKWPKIAQGVANTKPGAATQGNQPKTLRRGWRGAQMEGNKDTMQGKRPKTLRRGQIKERD